MQKSHFVCRKDNFTQKAWEIYIFPKAKSLPFLVSASAADEKQKTKNKKQKDDEDD